MTDTPTPSVQPVRAWAVVDKDGRIASYFLARTERQADVHAGFMNKVEDEQHRAPHRVEEVFIVSAVHFAALLDAAENLLISEGMGWDLDGAIERLRKAAPPRRNQGGE